VPTLAALRALRGGDGDVVEVTAIGTGGRFRWDARAFAIDDGILAIGPAAAAAGSATPGAASTSRWFGAAPNASAATNTAAFAAASAVLSRAGGTLIIPPGTYRVGVQTRERGPHGALRPADIIRVEGCGEPVAILGRGATLRTADRLRFGTFDPNTGAAHTRACRLRTAITARTRRLWFASSTVRVPVRVEGLTLDGNAAAYILGGEWGDTGRRSAATAIVASGNTGGLALSTCAAATMAATAS
jgi:hypothetical protein